MATPVVTKTAWKLQEIVAHASNVSSLVLGKASGRLLATGGDDCRVNLWSINKPNCIMSLTGHTSPVESVRLNTPEELIVAGSQSGSIRVWDLEAAKILRTLMGHKANICSLDFHPYGEFVASGSQDTNIKVRHSAAHLPILSSVRDMVTSSPSLGQRTCGLGPVTSTWDPSLGKPPTSLFGAQ